MAIRGLLLTRKCVHCTVNISIPRRKNTFSTLTSINQRLVYTYIIYVCFKTIANVTVVKDESILNYNP